MNFDVDSGSDDGANLIIEADPKFDDYIVPESKSEEPSGAEANNESHRSSPSQGNEPKGTADSFLVIPADDEGQADDGRLH